MKESVAGITPDRRLQLLLVASCLGVHWEGRGFRGAGRLVSESWDARRPALPRNLHTITLRSDPHCGTGSDWIPRRCRCPTVGAHIFAMGTRRTVVLTACTVLDRAAGAADVPGSASRSLGAVDHVSRPEQNRMSLNNSSGSSANPTRHNTRKPFESSAITGEERVNKSIFSAPRPPMLGNLFKAFFACGSGFLSVAHRSPELFIRDFRNGDKFFRAYVREYASLSDSYQRGVLSSKNLFGACSNRLF
jgi:hypothetical protein